MYNDVYANGPVVEASSYIEKAGRETFVSLAFLVFVLLSFY